MQLRHQSAQTWRQVKVAAVWGVQILLYPVYAAFQSARLLDRQLQQAGRQAMPRLRSAARGLQAAPPLPADAPIQNLLQSLSQLEVHLPGEPAADLALALAHSAQQPHRTRAAEVLVAAAGLTSSLQVRGIASRLGTGSLVLVTAQNETLDILTPRQQTALTQRMAWELASYWRQRRQLAAPPAQPSIYLPLLKPRQNALAPIRALQGLIAWMQQSSVAVSADLFQESRLRLPPALPTVALGQTELRSAQPAWEATEAQFYRWLTQAGRQANGLALAGWESGKTALTKRSLAEGMQQFRALLPRAQSLVPPQPSEAHRRMSAPADWLVALDRWVSEIPGLRAAPEPSKQRFDAANPQLTPAQTGLVPPSMTPSPLHHWLKRSLHSLRSKNLTRQAETTAWELTDTAALEALIKTNRPQIEPLPLPTRFRPQIQPQMQPQIQTEARSALSEWDDDHGMGRPLRQRSAFGAPLTSLDTANAEEAAMVPQSWIETEAQLVEYVKHPLEQLLEWLDHGMLWMEQRLGNLWHWLNRPIL